MPIDDIGGRLRRAREHRGLTLQDAANLTKLSTEVLNAIEANDFDRLPSGMYRKAYIRTLAIEVGLNPEVMANDYSRLTAVREDEPDGDREAVRQEQLLQQLAVPPRRRATTLSVAVALTVAWSMLQPRLFPGSVPVSESTVEMMAAAAPLEAIGFVAAAGEPSTIAAPPPASRALHVELAASDWCWVTAETDGRRVVYRLLKPGERVRLEADRLVSLRLGNAGAVMLSINGEEHRSAGREGEVVTFDVTPESVETIRDALERRHIEIAGLTPAAAGTVLE